MGEDAVIYNVEINGVQRKAIDLVAIKEFIQGSKLRYSVLSLDINQIDPSESVTSYIAKAAINTLAELESAVDEALGLSVPEEKVENIQVQQKTQEQAPKFDKELISDSDDEQQSSDDDEKIIL